RHNASPLDANDVGTWPPMLWQRWQGQRRCQAGGGAQLVPEGGNVLPGPGDDRQRDDSGASHCHDADVSDATPELTRRWAAHRSTRPRVATFSVLLRTRQCFSAVVGSMTFLISEILFAGKPPSCACLRTISSLGAMYT